MEEVIKEIIEEYYETNNMTPPEEKLGGILDNFIVISGSEDRKVV